MIRNMGMTDRIIRTILGTIIALLYLSDLISGVTGTIIVIIALLILLTAPAGFCPLYFMFKISTEREPDRDEEVSRC
jgi:hypothetical protein